MSKDLEDVFDSFVESTPDESKKETKKTTKTKTTKAEVKKTPTKKPEPVKSEDKTEEPEEDSLDDILGPSEDTPEEEEKDVDKEPEEKTDLDDILGPSEDTPEPKEETVNKPEESEDSELDDIFGEDDTESDEDKPEKKVVEKTKVKVEKVVEDAPTQKRSSQVTPVSITEEMLEELIMDEDFPIRTEEVKDEEDRTVYCIIGDKGTSKTTTGMSYDKSELDDDDIRKGDGTVIVCISLDRQSNKIANKYKKAYWKKYPESKGLVKLRKAAMKKAKKKKLEYKHPEQTAVVEKYCEKTESSKWGYIHTRYGVQGVKEIHVFNGIYYYKTDKPSIKVLSAEATYIYLLRLLDRIIGPMNPDYIIIDDMEKLNVICEMTMRKRNSMSAHEGFKNRNLWKERNDYIDHIFGRCVEYSRVAPIFTTYFRLQEVEDKKTGEKTTKEPAWIDRVKKETNTVIHLNDGVEEGKNVWYGVVQSSKDSGWKDEKVNIYTDYEGNGGIRNLMLKHETFERE